MVKNPLKLNWIASKYIRFDGHMNVGRRHTVLTIKQFYGLELMLVWLSQQFEKECAKLNCLLINKCHWIDGQIKQKQNHFLCVFAIIMKDLLLFVFFFLLFFILGFNRPVNCELVNIVHCSAFFSTLEFKKKKKI